VNNSVKNRVISTVFGTQIPEAITRKRYVARPPQLKMLPLYLVKGRSYASGQLVIASIKNWMHFKQPVVSPHAK